MANNNAQFIDNIQSVLNFLIEHPDYPRIGLDIDPKTLDMSWYATRKSCWTVYCLAGNYMAANPNCGIGLVWDDRTVMGPAHMQGNIPDHFGITEQEACWLFGPAKGDTLDNRLGRLRAFIDAHKPTIPTMDFRDEPQKQLVRV